MKNRFSNNDGSPKLPATPKKDSPRLKEKCAAAAIPAEFLTDEDASGSATILGQHAFGNGQLHPDISTIPNFFPLDANRLMMFCTHCWYRGQSFPLSWMTGEEAVFGNFYMQRLQSECQILLPAQIFCLDRWAIQKAMMAFAANPFFFKCRSIFIVLSIIDKYMEILSGGAVSMGQTHQDTAFMEATKLMNCQFLPQLTTI